MAEVRNVRWEDGAIRMDIDLGRIEPGTTPRELSAIVNGLIHDATVRVGASEEEVRLLTIVRESVEISPAQIAAELSLPPKARIVFDGTVGGAGAPEPS